MSSFLLAIDQGTTSSRAVIFRDDTSVVASHQLPFQQYYPNNGWVEHDPEDIWQTTRTCCETVLRASGLSSADIAGIGISNQRETTVIWDRQTGEAIYPAIVWQDRRTAQLCAAQATEPSVVEQIRFKTGLCIDPYFSASKINWILSHVEGARARAEKGTLAFGTIDTYLIWRLTGGRSHVTDATNAARTLLFNIREQTWDPDLLALFDVPEKLLPRVLDCADVFGECDPAWFGHPIPITGVAGDQQAAMIGQAAFKSGMVKSTYGTGCFVLFNTGDEIVQSDHKLLSTVAYRFGGKVTYGLEGSIFNAGTAIKWLRESLHFFEDASATQALAESIPNTNGVYFVPAFTGLGAPHWNPNARGAIFGLTRNTGIPEITRAALEAVCYQTCDLMQAMQADFGAAIPRLRVDGGMAANDWLLQFLSDILAFPVERPVQIETSALGAALLAGLGAGIYRDLAEIAALWRTDRSFSPKMAPSERAERYEGWQAAIHHLL